MPAGLPGLMSQNALCSETGSGVLHGVNGKRAGTLGDRHTGVRRRIIKTGPSRYQLLVIASMTTASNAHCVNSLREGRPRRPTTQNNDVRLVANRELSS